MPCRRRPHVASPASKGCICRHTDNIIVKLPRGQPQVTRATCRLRRTVKRLLRAYLYIHSQYYMWMCLNSNHHTRTYFLQANIKVSSSLTERQWRYLGLSTMASSTSWSVVSIFSQPTEQGSCVHGVSSEIVQSPSNMYRTVHNTVVVCPSVVDFVPLYADTPWEYLHVPL